MRPSLGGSAAFCEPASSSVSECGSGASSSSRFFFLCAALKDSLARISWCISLDPNLMGLTTDPSRPRFSETVSVELVSLGRDGRRRDGEGLPRGEGLCSVDTSSAARALGLSSAGGMNVVLLFGVQREGVWVMESLATRMGTPIIKSRRRVR